MVGENGSPRRDQDTIAMGGLVLGFEFDLVRLRSIEGRCRLTGPSL